MDTKKSTMATPTLETFANQTQIFASVWSLINSQFGGEDNLERAEVERGILLDMARRLIEDHDAARQEIASLQAQLEAVGAGGVEPLRKRCLHQISEPAQAQPVVAAPWQPIATAPEGHPAVVFWLDAEDVEHPERHEFDYLEDGVWQKHDDYYQHFCAVAPPGSCGPRELPPYTHWMPLTSPQNGATTPQPAAQAQDSVRVFWQQHTQADALSMTIAELHDDVELVIRAAPSSAAPQPAAQAGEYPELPDLESAFAPFWSAILGWRDAVPGKASSEAAREIEKLVAAQMRAYVDADRAARGSAQAAPVDAATWQPIASAPKDGKAILLRSKNGRIADGLWSAANSSTGFWAWAYVHQEPAEWMPKPGSPAARAQEQQP